MKTMTIKQMVILCATISATFSSYAGADGWTTIGYEINWGGPYGEAAYSSNPGIELLFTPLEKFRKEADGYGDIYTDAPLRGALCTILRKVAGTDNAEEIARIRTNPDIVGRNYFLDQNVIPGVTYTYEIVTILRADGIDSMYKYYTTGPTNASCTYIYRAEIETNEVVFSANEGERRINIDIYKDTISGSFSEYPAYFITPITSVTPESTEWIDVVRADNCRSFTVYVDENDTGAPREAIVTIDYNDFMWPIRVRQSAKNATVVITTESGGEVAIPTSWFSEKCAALLSEHSGDYVATAFSNAANGRKVWECYVADLDPSDADSDLLASIRFVNGVPKVIIEKGRSDNRIYRTWARRSLDKSETPVDVTDVSDLSAAEYADYRFFHISVELP